MKKILFATSNESKSKRFSKGLLKKNIEVLNLKDLNIKLEAKEDGKTAIENALIKAREGYKKTGMSTIGMDDTLYLENVPEEEWIRVENTHEAIIDKETFRKAQILSVKDTKVSQTTKKLSIWAGLLKCADCKRAMNKKTSTNKLGKSYEYYICSTYRKKSNKLCTKHTIKVENLTKIVLKVVNFHIDLLVNINRIIEEIQILKVKILKELLYLNKMK